MDCAAWRVGTNSCAVPPAKAPTAPDPAANAPEWREKEKALVRRLDLTFMPLLWILYFHNYLDRNNIAQARLSSFEEDLGLEGTDFNSAITTLTAGYMVGQIPSNMLLTRIRPGIYLSCCAFLWSILSACTAAVQNHGQLLAVRFFLGLAEAPFFPGAVYVLSSWYTRAELARRITSLYAALCIAMGCSGLIAAGVFSNLEGAMGLAGWQWLFIIEASTGAFFSFLGPFFIPDFPHSNSGAGTIWLTEDQRNFAAVRLAADRVSEPRAKESVWNGLKLVLTDVKAWVFCLLGASISCAYGFNNFYPSIVRSLGLGSRIRTVLLTAPPYFMTAITAMLLAWSSDRRKERGWHMTVPMCITLAAYIISAATLSVGARYFASFMYIGGSFSANPLLATWIATTLGRTPEKRAAGIAFCNVASFFGNLVSPYFFPQSDEPRYLMAMLIMGAFSASTIGCILFMKWILVKENRKLKETADRDGTPYVPFTT
ncbi:major facilitator superfamily domain-containing protein [Stachybotrys elegans]|uniref:Major facilitator superfamily domain-containing protein n=1 Tax=Stachybotrys elegans TaxID=80388 RepID=A0A8K0WK30_9HYPO|nr:major facilitator superfamily domain-containing protein [Stachybotrys elegans]